MTAAATRRAPAKKAPAKRAPRAARPAAAATAPADLADTAAKDANPIGPDGEIRPVRIGQRGRTPNPMVDIFEIDDVMYQAPARPSPALLIAFQLDVKEKGRDEAVANLLVAMLGRPALEALAASPEVSEEDMSDVFTILYKLAFDAKAPSDPS